MQQVAKLNSDKNFFAQRRFSDDFYRDTLCGLSSERKFLYPKYFYDRKGSEYFDQICQLKEYYPYQTELKLLPRVAGEVASILEDSSNDNAQNGYALIEFGAGSLQKVKPLLQKIPAIRRFMPIDISGEHLHVACGQLQQEFPSLQIQAVVGDFTQSVALSTGTLRRLGFFPGSTIGNLAPGEAKSFLVNAGQTLGRGSYMLIGVDTKKSPNVLHTAYNDSQGITARFNLNILQRINRELGANINGDKFEHYAFYNAEQGRVEMHLVCRERQTAMIDGCAITFEEGESIHTENSYKYTPREFTQLAQSAGWRVERHWTPLDRMFALYLMRFE